MAETAGQWFQRPTPRAITDAGSTPNCRRTKNAPRRLSSLASPPGDVRAARQPMLKQLLQNDQNPRRQSRITERFGASEGPRLQQRAALAAIYNTEMMMYDALEFVSR